MYWYDTWEDYFADSNTNREWAEKQALKMGDDLIKVPGKKYGFDYPIDDIEEVSQTLRKDQDSTKLKDDA